MFPPGTIISFSYSFWEHDPHPFVLVADAVQGVRVRGFNLHYLTIQTIQQVLKMSCEGPMPIVNYHRFANIPIVQASFRTYLWGGVNSIREVDCKKVLAAIDMQQNYDPTDIERIRNQINDQIRQPEGVDNLDLPDNFSPITPTIGTVPQTGMTAMDDATSMDDLMQ